MFKLRVNTFETNSSSVHTLVLTNDDTYQKWYNGELYYDLYDEKFVTYEEARQLDSNFPYPIDRENLYQYEYFWFYNSDNKYKEMRFVDFEIFINCCGYETYEDEYLTKDDIIHAVGYYGHD